jgi:putative transposase
VFAKKKGLTRRAGPPVHDDLVRKVFTADGPNRLWLTDITEHRTGEGKLYLCAIKDVCSGRIVGYSIDARMKASLAVSALRNAVRLRDPAGAIVHSDRGSQFRSRKFVKALHRNGLIGSMGRVGACGDNAAMESFFALLQKNVLDRQRWQTREQLRLAIVTWIERTYHRRRRQRRLGRLTPIEFETLNRHATAGLNHSTPRVN